ncbi:MAG: hypothetical protein ABI123_04950, partial [Ginsengibacter sp.]
MKKIIFGILFISLVSFNCKKNNDGLKKDGLNISLHDTSLSVIQKYIQGNWKLQYEKGGICGNCTNYIDNFYWRFGLDNKIQQTYNRTSITDTSINWSWGKPAITDSTYLLNFPDKRGIP